MKNEERIITVVITISVVFRGLLSINLNSQFSNAFQLINKVLIIIFLVVICVYVYSNHAFFCPHNSSDMPGSIRNFSYEWFTSKHQFRDYNKTYQTVRFTFSRQSPTYHYLSLQWCTLHMESYFGRNDDTSIWSHLNNRYSSVFC